MAPLHSSTALRAASGRRLPLDAAHVRAVDLLHSRAKKHGLGIVFFGGWGLPEPGGTWRAGPVAVLVDALRPESELHVLAEDIQTGLEREGGRPVQVLARFQGRIPRCEADFSDGVAELLALLPDNALRETSDLRKAARELYCPINLPRRLLGSRDFGNGLLGAAVFTASFSLALGFHGIAPTLGFVYGLFGRYLARGRAWISFSMGNGPKGNAVALAVDAVHGIALMTLVINPAAGLGISLRRIIGTSVCHTLSKGAMRLFIDKRFSVEGHDRQAMGVTLSTLADFCHGLTTSFMYAGWAAAGAVQAGLACWCVWVHFWPRKAGESA
ncbi:MAG TPA: hypothetical protein DCZ01_06285 [Elusimicrobia bacterium]|nr:MAG: hypothetical protein A2X37_11045 [Elusimicrobia bacterium GWA2_66_18]HAZ08122.1 hypothetical protein [Elusimicrobiota bacterium]